MLTSVWYRGPADLSRMIDLLVAGRLAGTIDRWPTLSTLRLRMSQPGHQAETRLWEARDGRLLGFATLTIGEGQHRLHLARQPGLAEWTARALLSAMLDWAIARSQQISAMSGEPAHLAIAADERDILLWAVLDRERFQPAGWQILRMVRPLDEPLPPPAPPPGYAVRPLAGESELERWIALHEAAFGAPGPTVEYRRAFMRSAAYQANLDLVAVAPDGTLAAFCVGTIDHEENRRTGRREGWTEPIGTHPAYRRQGLARATILTALHRLRDQGLRAAVLGCRSDNPGARQLYQSLGYREVARLTWLTRHLE